MSFSTFPTNTKPRRYNVYVYVHIPTGNIAKTLYTFSEEVLMVCNHTVMIEGAPMVEWEMIKIESVLDNDPEFPKLMRDSKHNTYILPNVL